MSDTEVDGEITEDEFAQHKAFMAMRNQIQAAGIGKVIKAYSGEKHINFFEQPTTDEYGTVSLGTWGGYLVQILPMIFNDRVVLTPESSPWGYDHGWCYERGVALLAVLAWDPETEAEPVGYKKRATMGLRQAGEKARAADEVPYWLEQVTTRWGGLDG